MSCVTIVAAMLVTEMHACGVCWFVEWRLFCLFQTLAVTDDTVLEEHNEDPAYTQMHLIDDGGKWILLVNIHAILCLLFKATHQYASYLKATCK